MKRLAHAWLSLAVLLALTLAAVGTAAAATNAECDNLQLNDNSWVVRDASVAPSGPWVSKVTGSISLYDYALCYRNVAVNPLMTGSGAWIAIEGPHTGGGMGGNSIIQVGYWKCAESEACGVSGIPSTQYGRVVYFYAFGNADDVFHQPHPQSLGLATTSSSFEVALRYLSNGTRQWEFIIDGVVRKVIDDSWRTWNREKVQVGNEVWNEGDQLGGRPPSGSDPGNKQKFRNITWYNGTTQTGLPGAVYRSGHCYPWASWQTLSSAAWDAWTNLNHTNC